MMTLRAQFAAAACACLLGAGALHVAPSPVADAAMRGDVEAVRTLLKQGADVNAAQGDGMTALHWAAERGSVELAEMLLHAGASTSAVTRIGSYTPLHLASRSGSAPLVRLLLKSGSDPAAVTTNSGVTPLHHAAAAGNPDVVSILLEHGAQPDVRAPESGQTPLMFAAAHGHADAVRVLIAHDANPNLTTKTVLLSEQTALDNAANRRRTEILNALRPAGEGGAEPTAAQVQAAIRTSREVYSTPARPTGDAQPERNPDADPDDGPLTPVSAIGGLTALHYAAREGHVDAARALLEGGAKINALSGADRTTPLLMATLNGQFDVALLLIERGASPNLASEAGTAPLYAVLERRWANRTRYPQPIAVDYQKTSYLEVLEALLVAGAEPDVRLNRHLYYMTYTGCGNANCGLELVDGASAFWRAAYATDVEAMRLLYNWGADPFIPTRKPANARARAPANPAARDASGLPANPAARDPSGLPANLAARDPSGLPPIPPGGPAVYAIHAAAGVGYGEGYAGNSHRHAPNGWLPSLKFLIEDVGMDVNLRDDNGYTALHHAAARGDNETILYLVSKGAAVTVVSRRGQTTADMANGPVSRITPFPATVKLLESLGSKNNHRCASC